jgi:hypothetical protein
MPIGRPKAELLPNEDECSQDFNSAFALDSGCDGDACSHRTGGVFVSWSNASTGSIMPDGGPLVGYLAVATHDIPVLPVTAIVPPQPPNSPFLANTHWKK